MANTSYRSSQHFFLPCPPCAGRIGLSSFPMSGFETQYAHNSSPNCTVQICSRITVMQKHFSNCAISSELRRQCSPTSLRSSSTTGGPPGAKTQRPFRCNAVRSSDGGILSFVTSKGQINIQPAACTVMGKCRCFNNKMPLK